MPTVANDKVEVLVSKPRLCWTFFFIDLGCELESQIFPDVPCGSNDSITGKNTSPWNNPNITTNVNI